MEVENLGLNRTANLILHDVGLLLHVPGIMAVVSIPVCYWCGESYAVFPFLQTAIASILPGQLLYHLCSPKDNETHTQHAMQVVAITWVLVSIIGSIPFLGIANTLSSFPTTPDAILNFKHPWNALFESFSGFTGTGLSVAVDPSVLPRSLQWWRSFSEWVDGAGVVVLSLAVLTSELLVVNPSQLYSAVGRRVTIMDSIRATARDIARIYAFYTGLGIALLALLGMPLWEAVNHGLTGIATGGFSITKNSITDYSPPIQLAIVLIMIMGAISFPMHYQLLWRRQWIAFWHSAQHQVLLLLLVIGTVILLLENRWSSGSSLWIDSLFQWASALTTCGFGTVKLQEWSTGAKLLLCAAMVMGGTAGSTAGGLKLNRSVTLCQGIQGRFRTLLSNADPTLQYHLKSEKLADKDTHQKIQSAAVLMVLWLLLLSISIFVLSHLVSTEYTLGDVIVEAISATSNVGLSTGISAPTLHWGGKLMLILMMWMGRLEIVPILLLVVSFIRYFGKAIPPQKPDQRSI